MKRLGDKDLAKVLLVLNSCDVRGFDEKITMSVFGEPLISVRCHINDLRFCDGEKLEKELADAFNADVAWRDTNELLIRPK